MVDSFKLKFFFQLNNIWMRALIIRQSILTLRLLIKFYPSQFSLWSSSNSSYTHIHTCTHTQTRTMNNRKENTEEWKGMLKSDRLWLSWIHGNNVKLFDKTGRWDILSYTARYMHWEWKLLLFCFFFFVLFLLYFEHVAPSAGFCTRPRGQTEGFSSATVTEPQGSYFQGRCM